MERKPALMNSAILGLVRAPDGLGKDIIIKEIVIITTIVYFIISVQT